MPHRLNESLVETALLGTLRDLGYATCAGQDLDRDDLAQPLLLPHLRDAIARLNPHLPPSARQEALRAA